MKQSLLLILAGMMLFAGCSSVPTKDIQIVTEANPKVNFDGYATYRYTWVGEAAIVRGQWKPPAFDTDAEIKNLIDRELKKRGMTKQSDNADLVVTFSLGVDMEAQKLKVDPKTKIELLENVPAGSLMVIFVDSSTGYVTWAGAATAQVQENPSSETVKARLDYIVTKMLKELPK